MRKDFHLFFLFALGMPYGAALMALFSMDRATAEANVKFLTSVIFLILLLMEIWCFIEIALEQRRQKKNRAKAEEERAREGDNNDNP